ncbi:MAG: hypothetical protein ACU0CI_05945 [Shimia sp.]
MRILTLFAPLAVGACGFINYDIVEDVIGVSPTEADPSQLLLFIETPPEMQPRLNAVEVTTRRETTGEVDAASYAVQRVESETRAGWRIAPQDWARFRGQQVRAREWELDDGAAPQTSFDLSAEPCRIGAGPNPEATASVFIQYSTGQDPSVLFADAPIGSVFSARDIANFPQC